jgi:lipopolysaccharide transport system ATP-binding protein
MSAQFPLSDPSSEAGAQNPDIVLTVKSVSKAYRIWRDPAARLKAPLWNILGKALPNWILNLSPKLKLRAQNSARYYKDFYALKDINFELHKGESLAIIGRNGSGKSTLLQIIAGTLSPTAGEVKVTKRIAALLELGSGFNPEFTGRENVYLNASVLGLKRKEIDARLNDILAFADIGDFIDQPVKTYSSGMSMRLAFAVIAHVDAEILIVDEALAVGDVFFVQKCMRFIRKFQEKGTLILVTHDTGSAQSLCQKAIWLHKGDCKGKGSIKTISEDYLKATYAENQGVALFDQKDIAQKTNLAPAKTAERVIDQRAAFINQSNLRNDIEIFDFNPHSAGFGAGGAIIEKVQLLDASSGQPLSYGVGGEDVALSITIRAKIELTQPIIGFLFKNHLGQVVFAENTYITYVTHPHCVQSGEVVQARFHFPMPYLPAGDYVITAAIADGTQEDHVQHHFLHDALAMKIQQSHICHGLIGVPMKSIELKNIPPRQFA